MTSAAERKPTWDLAQRFLDEQVAAANTQRMEALLTKCRLKLRATLDQIEIYGGNEDGD